MKPLKWIFVLGVFLLLSDLTRDARAGEFELAYDDGSQESVLRQLGSNDYGAMRLTPPVYPAPVIRLRFLIGSNPFMSHWHRIWVLDDDGPGGSPGTTLMGPDWFQFPETIGWVELAIPDSSDITIEEGDLYVAFGQSAPSLDGSAVAMDLTAPHHERAWKYETSTWSQGGMDDLDLVIRAVVDVDTASVPVRPTTWGRLKQLY